MALKLAPVATCDKHSEWGHVIECPEPPVIEISTGKILCIGCAIQEVKLIASGKVPTAEFSAFDAEEAAEQMGKFNTGSLALPAADITQCPECKKGPFKHLQAHRRKYHGKFVRGPKKDNPAKSEMEELPNLQEETRQLVDPDKVPPPPPEDGF